MNEVAVRQLRTAAAILALLLAAVVAAVLSFAYPSSEAVRLRNALLVDEGERLDPTWTPDRTPSGFLSERHAIPDPIRTAALQVVASSGGGDLEVARALAGHLLTHALHGGRIDSFDVVRTYQTIIERGTGYCADIVDAFVALSHAAGIPVRLWAFSFDGLGGHGHVVVEIFDRQRAAWIMLDVFNNAQPIDALSAKPLAAMDFRTRFLIDPGSVKFVPLGPWRREFVHDDKLVQYYANGIQAWYFWNGNNVVSRSEHWLVKSAIVEEVAELASIALGMSPRIVVVPSLENEGNVRRLLRIRGHLMTALAASCVLAVALVACLGALAWLRRGANARTAPPAQKAAAADR